MNNLPSTAAAGLAPAAVAPALLDRHKTALRSYVHALTKGETAKVEAVVEAVWLEAQTAENAEFEEDPTVWLFANARRRVAGAGLRDDVSTGEAGSGAGDDETGQEGEEPRVVVHRTIGSLTPKQQETLRLKFQFNLNLEEIASVTGQAKSGTVWLLHHAIDRIGQALGGRNDDASPLANDPRVTAYALDEMDASERRYFEKGVANGKALLEREKAIRAWGGHITGVLSSGAPVPKRRRKKRGAVWWKTKAFWAGLALAAVVGLFWAVRQKTTNGAQLDAGRSPDSHEAGAGSPVAAGPDNPKPAAFGSAPASARNALRPSKEPRPVVQPGSTAAGGSDRQEGGESLAPARRAAMNSNPGDNLDEGFFRRSVDQAKTMPAASQEPSLERRATPVLPIAGSAGMAAKDSAPAPTGAIDREITKEIELVRDQPGQGKGAEAIDPIPAMGGLRRQLAKKQWPRRGQVHLGEMLKNVPVVRGAMAQQPIETHLERAHSPWDDRKQIVRVALRAKDSPAPARGPANLVFAIDVSKSMAGPNRLPLVQEGVRRLVDRLRPDDRISVVTYAAKADLALAAQPAARSGELRQCLAGLEAAGLTNGSAGLRLAYATARNHWIEGGLNVVVLCTDGNFNLGTTDESALAALAAAEAKNGVQLSVFGFGRTDRNDLRLEILATNGGGRSCYVNTEEEAERQLVAQIDGLFAPVARDVRLRVEFNPALVEGCEPIGDEPDRDTTGTVGALLPGHSVTALFEVTPKPVADGAGKLGRLEIEFTLPESGEQQRQDVALAGAEQPWAKTGVEFRFAVAMVEFGRILRNGQPAETAELDRLEAWVRENLAEDVGGYRTELLQNLELARALVRGTPAGG